MGLIKGLSRALLFCIAMAVVAFFLWKVCEKAFGHIKLAGVTTTEIPSQKTQPGVDTSPSKTLQTSAQSNASPASRCEYNGQSYVEGDITKTDQGWIRCTPTIVFTTNSPDSRHTGSAAWTSVQ